MIDALVQRHEALAQLYFKALALPFQRVEPKVTEEVVRQSIKAEIPVLNIPIIAVRVLPRCGRWAI